MKFLRAAALGGILPVVFAGPLLASPEPSRAWSVVNALPLAFEANQGQTDSSVSYLARSAGFTLFLKADGAVLAFPGTVAPAHALRPGGARTLLARRATPGRVLRMRWLGGGGGGAAVGEEPLPGVSNYFLGRDPSRWVTDVPHYRRVRLTGVYPGIDLVYHGAGTGRLEFDWDAAPGSDPGGIALRLRGMDSLRMDASGDVLVGMGKGRTLTLVAPRAYQGSGAYRVSVPVAFRLEGGDTLELSLGSYDLSRHLVIDPALAYSTYLGGGNLDPAGTAIAVDASGNAYVTGGTDDVRFPLVNALQGVTQSPEETFVSKIDPAGDALVYSTYLGGAADNCATGIAVDGAGDAHIVGYTDDRGTFPLAAPFQAAYGGGDWDAYVCALNPSGDALVYSTYLGGSGSDCAYGIATDPAGDATVVGATASSDFPLSQALQTACMGCTVTSIGPGEGGFSGSGFNAFVTKFNPVGSVLEYSTFLGTSDTTGADCVALDSQGNAYIGGAGAVPLASPLFTNGGGFVCKVSSDGRRLIYSTQFGSLRGKPYTMPPLVDGIGPGSGDVVMGIAVDGNGDAYITGQDTGGGLPVLNALQTGPTLGGAFAAKIAPGGTSLDYSTYLGGAYNAAQASAGNVGRAIAVDSSGDAWIAGYTASDSLPLVDAFQTTCMALHNPKCSEYIEYGDAFVEELDPSGAAFLLSSYLGGSGSIGDSDYACILTGDYASGIAVDPGGNAYVAGETNSQDFPLVRPLQASQDGPTSAFVAKIGSVVTSTSTPTATPSPDTDPTASPTVTPSPSRSPSSSPSPTASRTATPSPTGTITPTATVSPTFTVTPVVTPTAPPLLLTPHYPNPDPAGPDGVWLPYTINTAAWVDLEVYDVSGELVRTWGGDPQWEPEGTHQRMWDEDNGSGRAVASGVYLVRIRARDPSGDQQIAWEKCAVAR